MSFSRTSSRRRFNEYTSKLKERRASGEFNVGRKHDHGPTPVAPRSRSFFELVVDFWGLVQGHRAAVCFALATLSVSTLLKLVPPVSTKLVIDYVLTDNPIPADVTRWIHLPTDRFTLLIWIASAVVAISVVDVIINVWGRWYATRATKRVQLSVRRRVFEHAVRLPLDRVYQLKSGGVSSILREDAGGVAELIFSLFYNPWRAIVQLVGSLVILAWVDWRLLMGSLILLPTVFMTHRTWISRIRPLYRDIRRQRQDVDSHSTEAFGGMRVVRAFGRQRSEAARFSRGNHLLGRQELSAWWWARGVEIVWQMLLPLASSALLLYGGWQVLAGQLSLGDLMMFLAYLMMLLGPLATLANSATQLQNNLAGLERVLDLLEEPTEMPALPGAISLQASDVAGHITLHEVDFGYNRGDQLVLRDVSLDVPPGQMVALVGPSGSGKTTLCNLVARYYDPTSGRITLDGVDLREIEVESYRNLLGIVEQDIFLFDGTVAENIGYAVRHATDRQIRDAAEIANADGFIEELPQGYDTVVGERGVRLSGGQRQRIAIARAVLADPRILILDEATSNLDTESERLIQQSLRSLMEGRTSFVIAHRLSTITHADRIVVIENGRIAEIGIHDDLMAASGRYRDMVQMQLDGV